MQSEFKHFGFLFPMLLLLQKVTLKSTLLLKKKKIDEIYVKLQLLPVAVLAWVLHPPV